MMKPFITTFFLLFFVVSCFAQSVCEQMATLKQKYYGFSPLKFTEKQLDEKSADLDKFWNFAKNNKPRSVDCLKSMILAEDTDTYFCYDASALLLSLDEKEQYLDVVLAGLKKCKVKELQLEPYLQICFMLGAKGKDISELTEKLISEPKATVFLTEHVITLSAVDASLFLYNEMGTEKAEKSLLNTIANGNEIAKGRAAVILDLLSTEKGDSVLSSMIAAKQLPDSVIRAIAKDKKTFISRAACNDAISRDEVLAHLNNYPGDPGESDEEIAGNNKLICSACKNLKAEDADVVRAARQRSLPALSAEALYDYFALTTILMTIRHK